MATIIEAGPYTHLTLPTTGEGVRQVDGRV